MKTVFVLALTTLVAVSAAPQPRYIPVCESSTCKIPQCQCSTNGEPAIRDRPQFVILSSDDSATSLVYEAFIKPEITTRKNPDGCPISGTFFVPHEYTDYSVVNKLHNNGFEIGSHSITKNFAMEYWQNGTLETLKSEMSGQKQILTKFANIPKENITGARFPQLQLGARSFEALHKSGFLYDSSWPTQQFQPLFPYSLDYASHQNCHVQQCQTTSTPGLWEIPINDWVNQEGVACNDLLGCATHGTAKQIFEWMKENFNKNSGLKTPVSLRITYSWYISRSENPEALRMFLDYLARLQYVYIVSNRQALKWFRNPTGSFSSCQKITPRPCSPTSCRHFIDGYEKYMVVCGACPKNYPWLGNPLGQ